MDFEKLVNGHKSRCCIISVERYEDGKYGNIRIQAASKALRDDAVTVFHREYVSDSPYYYYLPQDKNFEDYLYRCACLGEPLHTYLFVEPMNLWVNMFFLPLESDREDIGYCMYSCDVSGSANVEAQAALAADTATEALEISIRLGRTDRENIQQVFDEVLEDLRQESKADHAGIVLSGLGDYGFTEFSSATGEKVRLNTEELYAGSDSVDIAEYFEETVGNSTCAIVKDENDRKWLETKCPALNDRIKDLGIETFMLFPLKHNREVLGYLWLLNFDPEEVVRIKEILELSTALMASEISNYRLMKQLEYLSSMDILTGCKNRNAMNNTVNEIVSGKRQMPDRYAVVFGDLNGLKRTNDEQGHDAGDHLLRTASVILGHVFADSEIYRAGGDEFVIITPNIPEEELKDRFEQVNQKGNQVVLFSFGYEFLDAKEDIRTAMRIADEKMYLNKNEYYAIHPEEKYR